MDSHVAAMLDAAYGDLARDMPLAELIRGYEALSDDYRADKRTPRHLAPNAIAAYATARLPATVGANVEVLSQLRRRRADWTPRSLIDMGAGLGPSALAAAAVFPTVEDVVFVDDSPTMRAAGAAIAQKSTLAALRAGRWVSANEADDLAAADLVVASYVLGEMPAPAAAALAWWKLSTDTLVLIEPGTPTGYQNILSARSTLLAAGASLLAPCPHGERCPLEAGDWCHFSARVVRSPLHRAVKHASLTTEDEKFSYLIAARVPPPTGPTARIIGPPVRRSGHVRLKLCNPDGTATETVVARSDPSWREAKQWRWGDSVSNDG